MKVWVVMVADRHFDPDPNVFTVEPAAMEYARAVLANNLNPDLVEDEDIGEQELSAEEVADGTLYCAVWSHEGDYVLVVERETDPLFTEEST